MIQRWLAPTAAVALLGCSGNAEHYAPAEPGPTVAPAMLGSAQAGQAAPPKTTQQGGPAQSETREGELELSVQPTRTLALGVIHFTVEDGAGRVVAGGDDEASSPRAGDVRNLSLSLPARADYSLSLSATTTDQPPTTCNARVSRFEVEAGVSASLRVFVWQCVAVESARLEADDGQCYWLADWLAVSRTAAPVGESISVSTFGHGYDGAAARVHWSTSLPEHGRFVSPSSAQTSFACQAPGQQIPLSVTIDDGQCRKEFTQAVDCL